jgi:Rho-binding antiterminator
MSSTYTPINCEFHDVLEATATTRRRVAIVFIGEDGQHETVQARITDLQASNGLEHMLLDDGMRIRLDAIVSVDGVSLHSQVP